MRTILAAGIVSAELPAELDTDLAVDQLLGPLFYRRLLAHRAFDTDRVRTVVDDFLWAQAARVSSAEKER